MQRIIECVPNFSEGRDSEVIEAIAAAVRDTKGVRLLYVDSDADYNRTVYTFSGEPEAVLEAAFNAARTGLKLIDMRNHKGGHPRMGALDVCPFVPVSGVSMQECVACAEAFGRRAAEELEVPVYLYEEAARTPQRRNLAAVRSGEYEGLADKLNDPAWKPDFGSNEFNARSGAIITGARPFLIAYNVNIRNTDVAYANTIAGVLRESGVIVKDADGNKVLGPDGQPQRIPGRLRCFKGLGVEMPKHGITQVSINLTDYHVTPPHVAYEEVKKEAALLGVEVGGSEIVGLVPKDAMLMAGKFYAPEAHDEAALMDAAIKGLGLSDLYEFRAGEKVIEYLI